MCDERERLIEYVYGEAEPDDRQRVEAHLADCHECRTEISGFRSVRDDLLAWAVPDADPIWRPVKPVPVVAARRSWPTWALAAAAGAVFTAGLAGGVTARGWLAPVPPTGSTIVAEADPLPAAGGLTMTPVSATSSAGVTQEDLARLEAAILEQVRTEMGQQLRTVRSGDTAARLAVIEQWMDDQISLNNLFNSKFGSLTSRTSSLSEQIELSRLQRTGLEGSLR